MDRINNTGKMIIDYKKELMKHYSPLVDESLKISLNYLQDKKVIDEKIIDMVINDSVPLKEFETFIMSKREFLKSMKELAEEFEKVRKIVNISLEKIGFTNFIETENNIENDTITILRQYSITPEFIKLYFGLEDSDMENIMKKRGFAEKFAVLRLSKIFKEILSEMRTETEYSQGFSKVYYNSSIGGFSVDYRYHINVNSITEENIDAKIKKIRDADRVVERKFSKKSGVGFYNIKPVEPPKEPAKTTPKNKQTEEKISFDELAEIQNQLIETNEKIQIVEKEEKPVENKVETKPIEKKEHTFENSELKNKNNNKNNQQRKEPVIEEKKQPNLSIEIKDEENESPFEEEIKDIPIKIDMTDTLEITEEVSNKKIEIDNSDDFMTGLIPENILNGGMSNFDEPGDDDFPDMDDPDDDTIDFA